MFTELGITPALEVQPPVVSSSKKLSNSFLTSDRLNAEYYQPKYNYLLNELKRFKTKTIRHIAIIFKSIEPGIDAYSEEGNPFIRVADLSKFGLSEPAIYLDNSTFKDVIRPQANTILLSKDASWALPIKWTNLLMSLHRRLSYI